MEHKSYSPLTIGIIIVTFSYLLFNLHGMLTLDWIGEWNRFGGGRFLLDIFIEDITGFVGIIFRVAAGLIAVAGIILFIARKRLSDHLAMRLLRWIFICEAIYWLGLLSSAFFSTQTLILTGVINRPLDSVLALVTSTAGLLVGSIIIPFALFKLSIALNPKKAQKDSIKWGLIAGTLYILVFWLSNTSIWISTIRQKGIEYLTTHPENSLNFALTTIGLLVLTGYTAYFTRGSIGTETVEDLKRKRIGIIVLTLGLFFLWNYLTWIYFGGDQVWSIWYAWFLGHNLDLWLLSLPLIGIALMFEQKES